MEHWVVFFHPTGTFKLKKKKPLLVLPDWFIAQRLLEAAQQLPAGQDRVPNDSVFRRLLRNAGPGGLGWSQAGPGAALGAGRSPPAPAAAGAGSGAASTSPRCSLLVTAEPRSPGWKAGGGPRGDAGEMHGLLLNLASDPWAVSAMEITGVCGCVVFAFIS